MLGLEQLGRAAIAAACRRWWSPQGTPELRGDGSFTAPFVFLPEAVPGPVTGPALETRLAWLPASAGRNTVPEDRSRVSGIER